MLNSKLIVVNQNALLFAKKLQIEGDNCTKRLKIDKTCDNYNV